MSDHAQQVASLVKHVRRIAKYEGITEGQAAVLRAAADELERTKAAAVTLGEIIHKQGRDLLDITGRHDLVDEDGDGDWGAVWESLYEMRAERDRLRAKVRHLEPGGSDRG